jgi:uncharacterized Tic20 family protein
MTEGVAGSAPSPGWYDDDHGAVRWWDGAAWADGPGAGAGAGYGPGYGPGPGPAGFPGPGIDPTFGAGYDPMGFGPPPTGAPGYEGYGYPPAYGAPTYGGYGPPGYGAGYGPPARSDGRTMALLAHLGVFVGGFIVPLIVYLTAGKTDPFVRHHASEALNFSLTYTLFVMVGMLISFATLFIAFIVFFPLLMIAGIGHIVLSVMAAVKANNGEWYRYPINIRFVSGAL